MKVHSLKTWPPPFQATWLGLKTNELRNNDRGFAPGDLVELHEWTPPGEHDEAKLAEGGYTGRSIVATILYITKGGSFDLPRHLCILSLRIEARRCPEVRMT